MTKTTVYLMPAPGEKEPSVELFDVEASVNPQIGMLQFGKPINRECIASFPFGSFRYYLVTEVSEKVHEVLDFKVVE